MNESQDPTVSFVVPVYNYERYLRECLDAILGLDGNFDFEIIAVDDGSTDDSLAILKSYEHRRVQVLSHEQNKGHAATVEEGLRRAKGAFIARIDPDDRYRPNFLTSTLPKFEKYPEVALVYGDAAQINESGETTLESSDLTHKEGDFKGNELLALLEENFICSPTVIARREAWLKALPVPQGLAFHDWYFTLKIARDHDFYYVNEVVADYRVHPQAHHAKIVKDRSEEESLFWLLKDFFSTPESTNVRERQKQASRRRIIAAHYLTLARKYFGFEMYEDARRCYLQALRRRPQYFRRADVVRQLAGTLMGREAYGRIKRALKSSGNPGPQ